MGKVNFSGPVYGAKALLWTYGPYDQTGTTGATTALFRANSVRQIPAYEDWFITEVFLTASTNSSVANGHAVLLKSEGGSTTGVTRITGMFPSTVAQTIVTLTQAGASTTWSTSATVTGTAGEYEGLYVPAGSSMRIVSSGITLIGGLQLAVMGFIRYVSSTRSE